MDNSASIDIKQLKQLGDHLFATQNLMLPVWQTLSEHFYPQRADFLIERAIGTEFSDHLIDSTPILFARDLGNSLHAMLRDGDWFELAIDGGEPGHQEKVWLEWASDRHRRLMEAKGSGFVRAMKQGDFDYVILGQCVQSVELNRQRNGYLFRNWHLRDVAWWDDETGSPCGFVRKWQPTCRDLEQTFGASRLHDKIGEKLSRNKYFETVNVRHYVIPGDMLGATHGLPYTSVFLDCDNDHIIEQRGIRYKYYIVPRFQTMAGSPYAYSMASVIALPNARMLQAMTHTILEAAERLARPPIIATEQVVRSDVDLSPDGITWVDREYDERLGAALRTLDGGQSRAGWPVGDAARQDTVEILRSAFYINKISMPPADRGRMTATEVAERMKQFRRENLPLFAPIVSDYNGQLCEVSFELGMAAGFFGSRYDIPEGLQGQSVDFRFNSPLTATEGEERMLLFSQTSQILRESAELDPGVKHNVDFDRAFRDAVTGVGAPQTWLVDPKVAQERRMMEAMQQAAAVAAEAGVGVPQ